MRLILLRHGRTGLSGRYVGSSDVPLSEEGREQILDLRSSLGTMKIDVLLASPMLRCTQSASLLELGLPMQLDSELREIDFGRWEGKTFAEIEAQDPELVQHWASGTDDFCFPDGEATAGFVSRVDAVRNRLLASDAKTMLLVTHGGVIRSLICGLLGLSQKNYLLFQVAKGHYSTIELYAGGGVLTGFNLGGRG
ncbi:MAG: histidine phosphatase family protein [Proteobacteria bacterium]|nr:histidine phosphatase family protein [Pseudomonadota bacterium]MBU1649232.1 histidine phosphatase family protein [Pseudomonadota bacterium]